MAASMNSSPSLCGARRGHKQHGPRNWWFWWYSCSADGTMRASGCSWVGLCNWMSDSSKLELEGITRNSDTCQQNTISVCVSESKDLTQWVDFWISLRSNSWYVGTRVIDGCESLEIVSRWFVAIQTKLLQTWGVLEKGWVTKKFR